MSSPYSNLPDHQFWRRAVSRVERFRMDPVIDTRFKIAADDRVATAGSCFAQHIARSLRRSGSQYYVAEPAPSGMSDSEAASRQYGVFSARTGNIYTVRQLLQLFEEAHGRRQPHETAWLRADGRFVDPYRPSVEPDGFANAAEVASSRAAHLAALRAMFATASVFVFTLGLTEAWFARADGAVFPVAPGVAGGAFDPARHAFVNLTTAEIEADLGSFVAGLAAVNPGCRVILTVSPVPLIATYEAQHVMVATSYSKAALRVAAEGARQRFPQVEYFPSYEIITGNYARGAYFADDLREVTPSGVDHAMRVFHAHFMTGGTGRSAPAGNAERGRKSMAEEAYDIICDEDAIDEVRS
jgi:hypothetical protein